MDKYFVYYDDGYYDNGDVGLKSFETVKEATNFIDERLNDASEPDLTNDYTLICGREIKLESQVVTKVGIVVP